MVHWLSAKGHTGSNYADRIFCLCSALPEGTFPLEIFAEFWRLIGAVYFAFDH
jgi:hypothetical protein